MTGMRTLNDGNVLDFDGTAFLERAEAEPASGDVAFHMALVIDSTANAFEAVLAVDATNDFQIDANDADPMANFTFQGFTPGSLVALSVAAGGNTVRNSVSTWRKRPLAKLDILVTSAPVITAPAAIWLEAIGLSGFDVSSPGPGETYDPTFHEITYVWTIQGSPLADYTAPQNMIPSWNNPYVCYG